MTNGAGRSGKARGNPQMGYGSPTKAAMRSWIWSRIGGVRTDGTLHTGDVLLMPSIEGYEIEEALGRGFAPGQLHIVDKSPAVVATLRREYPGINTYGVSVERACQRIAASGVRLLAANIDLCGNVSRPSLRILADCWKSGALAEASVFINVLRGREDAHERRFSVPSAEFLHIARYVPPESFWVATDGIDRPTAGDWWRLWTLQLANNRERSFSEMRPYVSPNGQSFLTVSFPAPALLNDTPPLDEMPDYYCPPFNPHADQLASMIMGQRQC